MGFKASLADRVLDQIRHVQHHGGSCIRDFDVAQGAPLNGLVSHSPLAAQRP